MSIFPSVHHFMSVLGVSKTMVPHMTGIFIVEEGDKIWRTWLLSSELPQVRRVVIS
jgi:hypothetical protein